ncbi:hypothetical protein QAD02_008005 [Eretmocerus hayati]|uniref:Uncharacterized protein n=1 Tax=Eretmocerus hayati TaxID=131215 RepID=A0ACC2N5V6_9HYME|nr:hypothetical protein QAD02_008005 [Eretmocerus hayati]
MATIRAYLENRDNEVPPDFIVPMDAELLEIIGQGESVRALRKLVNDQLQRHHDDIEMGEESLNQSMLPSESNAIDDLESIDLLSEICDEPSPEGERRKEDQINPDYESDSSDCDMREVSDKSEDVQRQKQKMIPLIMLSDDDKGDCLKEESIIELSRDSSSKHECTSRVASQVRSCKRSRTKSTGTTDSGSSCSASIATTSSRSNASNDTSTSITAVSTRSTSGSGIGDSPTTGINWFVEGLKELVRLITEGHDLNEVEGLTVASDLFLHTNQLVGSGDPDDNDTLKHCYGKSMIKITNEHNLCLPRAIVCAIEYLKNSKTKASKQEVRDTVDQQTHALELCEKAGVLCPDIGSGIPELMKFQIYLVRDGFGLIVFRLEGIGAGPQEKPIYNGREEFRSAVSTLRYKDTIILALDEERSHYEAFINFLGVARFIHRHPTHHFACPLCYRSYKASSSHKCTEKCEACISFNPCEPALYDVPCNDCNRVFVSQKCFDSHERRGSYYNNSKNAIATVCEKIRICVDCYKQYDMMFDKHECGVSYCVDCRSKHNPNDQCYIRVKAPVRVGDPNAPHYHPDNQFVSFDIESEQGEKFKDNLDPTASSISMLYVY